MSGTVARMSDIPTPLRDVWNADTCPASVLPWLAWAFSVDQWDPSWSDAQKRATIKASVSVHRYKGTIGALREAITALGLDAQVVEWFNQLPAGDPYTFDLQLNISQTGITQAQLLNLVNVVNGTKNLRSHLGDVIPSITSEARLYVGGVPMIGNEITLSFDGAIGIPLLSDGTAISDGAHLSNGYTT